METITNEPKGLGGWLILPALGLIVTPFRMCLQFYQDILPALEPETWNALTDSNSAVYHALWAPLIIFEVISSFAFFAFSLLLLWFFFRRSSRTPKLFVVWLVFNVLIQVLDLALANLIPAVAAQPIDLESAKDLTRSILGAAIWIPYFLKSKRVKNTFIEPHF